MLTVVDGQLAVHASRRFAAQSRQQAYGQEDHGNGNAEEADHHDRGDPEHRFDEAGHLNAGTEPGFVSS